MVWVFPEYGGQVAVRFERFKVVRQNLSRRNPGPWEVYDVANDPSETNDLAQQQPAWIDKAIQILKREMAPNPIFPLVVPGVNDTGQNNKRPQ
jgi:arylsulfatase A-like enzyme